MLRKNVEEFKDRIAEMYENKTIFISGGTGFMGKVLIEKLLRSCSGLKKIILLIRTKKGKMTHERLRDIMKDPVSIIYRFNLLSNGYFIVRISR